MPALLIAVKRMSDGSIDKVTVPYADSGADSVNSAKEEDRYRALGYETKILRDKEQREMEKRGELVRWTGGDK